MGTSAVTVVYDQDSYPILNLYRHYDGYPSEHGRKVCEFLNSEPAKNSNGSGCMAASMVAHFKTEPYNFYLVSPKQCGDFNYFIRTADSGYHISVTDYNNLTEIFSGNLEEFGNWILEN